MGLFKKLKKAAFTSVDPLNVSGQGYGIGGISDMILGKKDKGVKDSFVPLDPLQRKALGKFGSLLDRNTDGMANEMVARQENQIRQNAADTERQAKQLTAQRGLGNSSVGLNAIINSTRNMGDQIGATRAQLPGLKYNLETQNLNTASSGIQNILNNRIFKQGREGGGRTGGLAPLIGMGLGAYATGGSPAGAQIGSGLGSALTQMG